MYESEYSRAVDEFDPYSRPVRRLKGALKKASRDYLDDDHWEDRRRYSDEDHDNEEESNIFVRTIDWIFGILKSIISALIFLPKTIFGYVIWLVTLPIMLPLHAVANILLLPITLIKNAALFVWKVVTWPIGEIGSILLLPITLIKNAALLVWKLVTLPIEELGSFSLYILSGLKNTFWHILGHDTTIPIDPKRAEMYGQEKGRAKHMQTIEGRQYVIRPYEIEYGKNVGFFFKTLYYLKWTLYTFLWAVTFGYFNKAPSFATPYPAIYRRIVTRVEVDEEPIERYGTSFTDDAKSALTKVMPKNWEHFWWLPLLLLLLLVPTLYVGKNIHRDYKNETDTGVVHNPIEYIASKLSSEASFLPKSVRNAPIISPIMNGIEGIYDVTFSLLDIGWKSIELVGLTITNFLGRALERFAPWLSRPVHYVVSSTWRAIHYVKGHVGQILWSIIKLPLTALAYAYKFVISPILGVFSSMWSGFFDGLRYGFYEKKLESKSKLSDDALTQKLRAIVDKTLEREKMEIENRIQNTISEYIGSVKNDVDSDAERLRESYQQQFNRLQQEKADHYNKLIEEQMNTFTKSTIPEIHEHTHPLEVPVEEEIVVTQDLQRDREMGESMIIDPELLNVERELERKMETIASEITQRMNEQHAKFLAELRDLKKIQQESLAKKNVRVGGA